MEQDTAFLTRLLAARGSPPWPVVPSLQRRLWCLLEAGAPVDALAARIEARPPAEGPPLVLTALEAGDYDRRQHPSARARDAELAAACGRCDGGWLTDQAGLVVRCDHGDPEAGEM